VGRDAAAARRSSPEVAATARLRSRARRWAPAVVACGALLAAGCGDDEDRSDPGSSALGSPDVQTSAREADCLDWNRASVEDQQVIVESIAEYEGGGPSGTVGRTMPTEQAYEVFERFCERDYASAFKLYKIYVRAAAFSGAEQ
jgi:hypothetical protein